jgi:hypothetical protein|tara:strand:+ start:692 stop:982 length:291 start_codon:yes stop_codon:yes gene_type:complete
MPSVKKGEKQGHYMTRCVPMLIKEGKKQDQAVAQCLSMFKQKWKAKGEKVPDESSAEFQDALANFDWDSCPECLSRESDANHNAGIFELDIPNKKF